MAVLAQDAVEAAKIGDLQSSLEGQGASEGLAEGLLGDVPAAPAEGPGSDEQLRLQGTSSHPPAQEASLAERRGVPSQGAERQHRRAVEERRVGG